MALKTLESEWVDTTWRKVEFVGYGIIEVSRGHCRQLLGGADEPVDTLVGAIMKEGEIHEFTDQVVWYKSGEAKALVTIHVTE